MKEEVQAEGLVRQLGDFFRFLEVATFSYGKVWTTTDISRESNVKRATVDKLLANLGRFIPPFSI